MPFLFNRPQIEHPDTWRTFCPHLTLTTEPNLTTESNLTTEPALTTATLCTALTTEDSNHHKAQLIHDGYFAHPTFFSRPVVDRIATAIEQITEATGAAIWALLYDDLWEMMYALHPCLTPLLGSRFQLLPDIWVWNLRPNGQDRGWSPHRDRERSSVPVGELPRLLTVWIALTDATPENGCIYVLPASFDPRYHHDGRPNEEISIPFQDIRALPASAGTALGWSARLLHWGSRTSVWTQTPRISVAFEFQSHDFSSGAPFVLPPTIPPFSLRLGLVARQLLQYRHFVHLTEEMESVCRYLANKHLPQKRRFSDVLAKLFSKPS